MDTKKSVFETLNAINCNEHTETRNGLTYLSWAWAWQIVKKNYPTANYKVYENADGWNYFTDGRTCWVKTGVIIEDLECIEMLPVMDYKNRSIPFESVTSFDVNKTIQRSLTKACARHGLGLYIYAGEDLPDTDVTTEEYGEPEPAPAPKRGGRTVKKNAEETNKQMDIETYWKIVKAFAENKKPKSDDPDYKVTWIKMVNPTPEKIAKFDHDVQNYRASMGME